jgi:hypothetical protein
VFYMFTIQREEAMKCKNKKCNAPVCNCTKGESCEWCEGSGLCVDCEVEEAYRERDHITQRQDAWYDI